jgi:hypothetical protein
MPLKQKGSTVLIPLTEAENELMDIAVRVDYAIRYQEKHANVDPEWMTSGFGEELVCIPSVSLPYGITDYA